MLDAFHEAHAVVLRTAGERMERRGMGTTLIAALVDEGHVHVCHAGDVRAYALRAGGALPLPIIAERLVALAMSAGAPDDVTVALHAHGGAASGIEAPHPYGGST